MRLELTGKTDLAVRALAILAESDERLPTKGPALAALLGTTVHYLPQVMRPLVEARWVASESGPTGGYRLAPGAREVSLRKVIEAVEGPIVNGRCVLRDAACPVVEPCALHHAWSRARSAMVEELDSVAVVGTSTNHTTKGGKSR